MKFCIVHFNTPELTTCLCASINKFHDDAEIIILDNSNKRPFNHADLFDNVTVLDNTHEQLLKFNLTSLKSNDSAFILATKTNNCGSAKHSLSIQYLIDNVNDNFILLDSDVLLKKPVYDLITDTFCSADILHSDPIRYAPFIMFINVKKIKTDSKKFFDRKRMLGLSGIKYDTGASFYEDTKTSFKRINYNDYVVHYGNGSWITNRKSNTFTVAACSWKEFLFKNQSLYM